MIVFFIGGLIGGFFLLAASLFFGQSAQFSNLLFLIAAPVAAFVLLVFATYKEDKKNRSQRWVWGIAALLLVLPAVILVIHALADRFGYLWKGIASALPTISFTLEELLTKVGNWLNSQITISFRGLDPVVGAIVVYFIWRLFSRSTRMENNRLQKKLDRALHDIKLLKLLKEDTRRPSSEPSSYDEGEDPFITWVGETPRGSFAFIGIDEDGPWFKIVNKKLFRVSVAEIDYIEAWEEIQESGNDPEVIDGNRIRLDWEGSHDQVDPIDATDEESAQPISVMREARVAPELVRVPVVYEFPQSYKSYSRTYEPGEEVDGYDTLFVERSGETDKGEYHFFSPDEGTTWLKIVDGNVFVQVSEAELAYIEAYEVLNDDDMDDLKTTRSSIKALDAWNGSHDKADTPARQMVSLEDSKRAAEAAAEVARQEASQRSDISEIDLARFKAYLADQQLADQQAAAETVVPGADRDDSSHDDWGTPENFTHPAGGRASD